MRGKKKDNLPSMRKPSEGRKVKSVFQHLLHQTNRVYVGRNLDTGIPEAICHNSELSNSTNNKEQNNRNGSSRT
jgi:hypothetical protein